MHRNRKLWARWSRGVASVFVLSALPLLRVVAQQSSGCEGTLIDDVRRVPSARQLQTWARRYYPSIIANAEALARLVIGFVIDTQCRVLRHSAGILPGEEYSEDVVLALFPDVARHGKPAGLADVAPSTARSQIGKPRVVATWIMQPV